MTIVINILSCCRVNFYPWKTWIFGAPFQLLEILLRETHGFIDILWVAGVIVPARKCFVKHRCPLVTISYKFGNVSRVFYGIVTAVIYLYLVFCWIFCGDKNNAEGSSCTINSRRSGIL